MSGIVGILNLDGAPVDARVLEQLTSSLTFRGPDRKSAWVQDNIGFGHTLLATTFEAKHENQPLSLDNKVWIVADARIDGRNELIQKLRVSGRTLNKKATDPELILHAYHVWGTECVQYLIGDFCFAIWDKQNKTLFCARDHFGVKPFFYAIASNTIVFSNTFDCIRKHPDISQEFNDQAIADCLLFGFVLDLDNTAFKSIRRLPPAHIINWKTTDTKPVQYWSLPDGGRIRYRRPTEYIDHFKHLLREAVEDRLRTDQISVEMSGGLDSTAIAATANAILKNTGRPFELRAYNSVIDNLFPDEERAYSVQAAQKIGIPIEHIVVDNHPLFSGADERKILTPEPLDSPYAAVTKDYYNKACNQFRVALNGQGADEILADDCLVDLFGKINIKDLLLGILCSITQYHQRPAFCLKSKLIKFSKKKPPYEFPEWLNPTLIKQLDLDSRWMDFWNRNPEFNNNVIRASAYSKLSTENYWAPYLEGYDSGWTEACFETRWPFLDVRLITDLLAFQPIPWFRNKLLLRESMRELLPESVRTRKKAPLAGYPYFELLRRGEYTWQGSFSDTPEIEHYLNFKKTRNLLHTPSNPQKSWMDLRPVFLYYWMTTFDR